MFFALLKAVAAPCITPTDDLYINESSTLCYGTYYLNDTNNDGTIIINADNVALDCNGTSIVGNFLFPTFTGRGIYAREKINISISNCNIYNYTSGIRVEDSNNVSITNNTLNSNFLGILLDTHDFNILIANNTIRFNFFGIILDTNIFG